MKTLFTVLALVLLASCHGRNADILYDAPTDDSTLTVIFAGDVLLDRGVAKTIRRHGAEHLLQAVSTYFHNADYAVVNLECPITQINAPLMKKYIFRADDSCAAVLAKVGITHCALANNHSMDQGLSGLADTYRILREEGIAPLGYGLDDSARLAPALLEKNGIKVAIFNDCAIIVENYTSPAQGPGIANVPVEKLLTYISRYRALNPDVRIVALLHWGHEFRQHPSLSQRMAASQLVSAGVDVVVGHHPHVVQDIDTIRGKIVYYSIGNFVFDQRNPLGRKALMPIISFRRDTVLHHVWNVDIEGNRPVVRD